MKNSEKRGLLILIVVAVLIIGVIWLATRPKEEKANNNGATESAAQGEFTKVEEDGTIVNTSEKLKENKDMQGFDLTNIKLEEVNGETVLSARVTNNTGAAQKAFSGNVVLLDKAGNEIGRIPVGISETQAGEAIDIETSITERYANAYDFKLEK